MTFALTKNLPSLTMKYTLILNNNVIFDEFSCLEVSEASDYKSVIGFGINKMAADINLF